MRSFSEVLKDSPGLTDVHVASSLSARRRRRRSPLPVAMLPPAPLLPPRTLAKRADESAFQLVVPIQKVDDSLRTVYGWATVNSVDGTLVTDHQGDQVEDAEMIKAAHEFVTHHRHGGLLHAQSDDGTPHRGGQIVESMVLTADLQKALGIDLGKTGWLIGYRVTDPDAWALVKSGTLKAFSIGGRAQRVPL